MAFDDILTDRRSFLAGAGATGIAALSGCASIGGPSGGGDGGTDSGSAAAETTAALSTLRIVGREPDSSYSIEVNDPNASVKSSKEGGSISIEHAKDLTRFESTLGEGDRHVLEFDGNIQLIQITDGHVGFDVEGDLVAERNGGVKIWKNGFYYVVSAGTLKPAKGIENEDSGIDDFAQGTVREDDDRYQIDGDLSHIELRSMKGETVALRHTFESK